MMKKTIGYLVFLGAPLVLLIALVIVPTVFPATEAGVRFINQKADAHEWAKVTQADEPDAPVTSNVGGDDRAFGEALKDFGNEDGARRVDREAALARARNESVRVPALYVDVQQPWRVCIPFFEPMVVEARGYVMNLRRSTRSSIPAPPTVPVDNGYEQVGPDGIPRGDVNRGYDLPVKNDNQYLGLVGRVHSGSKVSEPFFIGSMNLLDPARIGMAGRLCFAVNQNAFMSDALGGFDLGYHYLGSIAAPVPPQAVPVAATATN